MTLAISTAIRPLWRNNVRTGTTSLPFSCAWYFGAGRMAAAVASEASESAKAMPNNSPVGGSVADAARPGDHIGAESLPDGTGHKIIAEYRVAAARSGAADAQHLLAGHQEQMRDAEQRREQQ